MKENILKKQNDYTQPPYIPSKVKNNRTLHSHIARIQKESQKSVPHIKYNRGSNCNKENLHKQNIVKMVHFIEQKKKQNKRTKNSGRTRWCDDVDQTYAIWENRRLDDGRW